MKDETNNSIATSAGALTLSMKDRLRAIGARIAGAAIRTNKHCPDETCQVLTVRPPVDGFICIGKLAKPTDHIVKGVNSLSLCFKQGMGLRSQWHLNRNDLIVFHDLIIKAIQEEAEHGKSSISRSPGCGEDNPR